MTEEQKLVYKGRIDNWDTPPDDAAKTEWGDARDGQVYLADDSLKLSVEVALATHRPLLLRGDPGTGKSSLAAYVARLRQARYYEQVVTSRTEAQDLMWRFDAVRKLAAATVPGTTAEDLEDHDFIEPGVLWWVINPEQAARRGAPDGEKPKEPAEPPSGSMTWEGRPDRAVVLIDEIDKADPDVPNALLVPIGSAEFRVAETGAEVRQPADPKKRVAEMLMVVTTNETRELPDAFLRRCVIHHLRFHEPDALVAIANAHVSRWGFTKKQLAGKDTLFEKVAERLVALRGEADDEARRRPSTAEYLDAVRASLRLGVQYRETDLTWKRIEQTTVVKPEPTDARGHGIG